MHLFRVAIGTLSLGFIASSLALAQDAAESNLPKLNPVFSDDFSDDTRDEYQIGGNVTWEPEQIMLADDAAITRELDAGSWAEFEVQFGGDQWAEGRSRRELRLWLGLEGDSDCLVALATNSPAASSRSGMLTLVRVDKRDEELTGTVIRQMPLPKATAKKLTLVYRYGLVTVNIDQSHALSAFIATGAVRVRKFSLEATDGAICLSRCAAQTSPAYPLLTEDQQLKVAEAKRNHEGCAALYEQEKYSEAIKLGLKTLNIWAQTPRKEHFNHAATLNNLASCYHKTGQTREAERLFKRALGISRTILGEKHPSYAVYLSNLAGVYEKTADYNQAEQLYRQAYNIRISVFGKDEFDSVKSLRKLSELYLINQKYQHALETFEEIRQAQREKLGERHTEYGATLKDLGMVYWKLEDYRRAEQYWLKSRDIFFDSFGEGHPDYIANLVELADLYSKVGEYGRSLRLLRQAGSLGHKLLGAADPDYAQILKRLGSVHARMGSFGQAELLLTRACDIERRTPGVESAEYATSINNLAVLFEMTGNYLHAEHLCLRALEITKNISGEKHPDYASVLSTLASIYHSMGEHARAEAVYKDTLQLRKQLLGKNHTDYAKSLNNLASLYHSLGDHSRAERLYRDSYSIKKSVVGKEHPSLAVTLANLAALYRSKGEYTRAEQLHYEAYRIKKKALGDDHPSLANTLVNLAFLAAETGNFQRAKSLHIQQLNISSQVGGEDHPSYGVGLEGLADLYSVMGEYAESSELYLKAFRIFSGATERALPGLSGAQARCWVNQNGPSADSVLRSLRLQHRWKSNVAYDVVWKTKGIVSRLRHGPTLSRAPSVEARNTVDRLREASLELAKLATAIPPVDSITNHQRALAAASRQKEALEKSLAELDKGTVRELAIRDASVEQLLQRLPEGVAVIDFVQLNDWEYVNTEITLQNDEGESEIRTVKKKVSRPVYDAFVLRADRIGSPNPAKWVPLGDAEPIETAISNWRVALTGEDSVRSLGTKSNAVGSKPNIVADSPADILRKRIWDKLEPHLDGIHTVVLLPDGALNRLPWAALPGRNDGQYLIHDYALTTASTGQQLYGHLIDPPIETPYQLLAAGGIDYENRIQPPSQIEETPLVASTGRALFRSKDDQTWNALPGAAAEADAIVNLWGQRGPVQKLSGAAAKEQSLAQRLPQSRFAHLATHGFFDQGGEVYGKNLREQDLFQSSFSGSQQASVAYRNPLLMTGIVMAGANVPPETDDLGLPVGEDGILTAEELSGLDLRNTELVTLSACETGLGDVAAGDGVYGLTRVLHKSGVRSVLASQWRVNDLATQELMKRFYENLWVKKQSKIDALRNAQLWILNHPDKLTAMGVGDVSRGGVADLPQKTDASSQSTKQPQTHPYFWAAFQLSGDWR